MPSMSIMSKKKRKPPLGKKDRSSVMTRETLFNEFVPMGVGESKQVQRSVK